MQRRDQFIRALIMLGRDGAKTNKHSFWSWLPKELMLHIISFIDFRSKESIGKSAQQIYQCAAFIFNHIPQLNDSLAESIHTQKDFKIMEKTGKGNHSEFRFSPTQQAEPLAEKTIEPLTPFKTSVR